MTPQWKRLLDHVMAIPEQVYEGWNSTDGWDNRTPFGRQFGEDGVSWCVIFDWDMYGDVGLAAIVPKVDNVSVFTDWARARGQWSEYPSIGAWANFGAGAHTEIVVGFDSVNVYTKGGNSVQAGSTDAGQGNGVWSHSTPRKSTRVAGYFAPHFPDGQCPPTADPADPRGGRAQTSYRWPGADPTPPTTSTPQPSEDDMPLTADDVDRVAQRVVYLLAQGLAGQAPAGADDQTRWLIDWYHQCSQSNTAAVIDYKLGAAGVAGLAQKVDDTPTAVAQALASGITLTVNTTKGA
ncbi:hypothetical protein ACFVX9_17850 [Kitasatospora sp. NPDC058243]|uniref:hypothetical protein n=1 Tax=Kitasatospora sp. NPDC058243 TaxID=3346397 RepID=UPI0036DB56E0